MPGVVVIKVYTSQTEPNIVLLWLMYVIISSERRRAAGTYTTFPDNMNELLMTGVGNWLPIYVANSQHCNLLVLLSPINPQSLAIIFKSWNKYICIIFHFI
jgi:hypothetical protein